MNFRQLLDERASFIDLVEITEPETNALRLVIEEMSPDHSAKPDIPISGLVRMRHGSQDRTFVLLWERYAAYTVINESYTNGNGDDVFEGDHFRLYSQSRYLRFVEETVGNVGVLHPGYKHWGVVCQWHVIDVISNVEPQISTR